MKNFIDEVVNDKMGLKTKEEMKMKLFTYHKLIEWIDDYYETETKEGTPKREWIDGNWKELCRSLGETFEGMVEDGWNADQRTLQEIVNDNLDELIRCNDWSVRDVRDRGEDLIQDLHNFFPVISKNIGTLKEIGRCHENWVDENWEEDE